MIWRVVLRGTAEQVVRVRAQDATEAKEKARRVSTHEDVDIAVAEAPPEFVGPRWPGRAPAELVGLTFVIGEVRIAGPLGAVAYRYATHADDHGSWIFDDDELAGDVEYCRPQEDDQ